MLSKVVASVFYAGLSDTPHMQADSVATLFCQQHVEVLEERVGDPFVKVQVGQTKGYLPAEWISEHYGECWQQLFPKFFEAVELTPSDTFYWGRLERMLIRIGPLASAPENPRFPKTSSWHVFPWRSLFLSNSYAQSLPATTPSTITPTLQETATPSSADFLETKKILQNDQLVEEARKQELQREKSIALAKKRETDSYLMPGEKEFWEFLAKWWAIKNVGLLHWDAKYPDYGLKETMEGLLTRINWKGKKINLLLLDTSSVLHLGLPMHNSEEYMILLSLPLIKALDLTKLEIALLIVSEMVRTDLGGLKRLIFSEDLKAWWGSNAQGGVVKTNLLNKALATIDDYIWKQAGRSLADEEKAHQYMIDLIGADEKLMQVYVKMLEKLDDLVRQNPLYKHYLKWAPTPGLRVTDLKNKSKLSKPILLKE